MKDAYWFRHDSNARNDAKIVRLRRLCGLEGLGLYWCVIECLRESEGYTLPISSIDDFCYELRTERSNFDKLVDCELLTISDDVFYSESLMKRMSKYDELCKKRKENGKKGGLAKAKQVLSKSLPNAKQKLSDKNRLDKNRLDKSIDRESDAFRVAEYLLSQIRTHSPEFVCKNINTWATDIDKAIRIDKRTCRELCEVAKWAHTNEKDLFWRPNLLSGKKLREKFDTIKIKIETKKIEKQPAQHISIFDME